MCVCVCDFCFATLVNVPKTIYKLQWNSICFCKRFRFCLVSLFSDIACIRYAFETNLCSKNRKSHSFKVEEGGKNRNMCREIHHKTYLATRNGNSVSKSFKHRYTYGTKNEDETKKPDEKWTARNECMFGWRKQLIFGIFVLLLGLNSLEKENRDGKAGDLSNTIQINEWKRKHPILQFALVLRTPYTVHIGNYVTFISVSFIHSFIDSLRCPSGCRCGCQCIKNSNEFFAVKRRQLRKGIIGKSEQRKGPLCLEWMNMEKKRRKMKRQSQSPVDHIRTVTMTNERQRQQQQKQTTINDADQWKCSRVTHVVCHCQFICTAFFFASFSWFSICRFKNGQNQTNHT